MRRLVLLLIAFGSTCVAQILDYSALNTRQVADLDRERTVLVLPGGILEEHGPYLPSGSDGIFNQRLAYDLAAFVAARPKWTAVLMPSLPLGAGAANEIGKKYSFPGSATVRPKTLRAVYMDLADQLGQQGFRWVFIVSGHGDPTHNTMLDQASDYFHDVYGGQMVNVFGYVWAMKLPDLRTPEEARKDGLPEHATMRETSVILALSPGSVAPNLKRAKPYPGQSIDDLERLAEKEDWPGYFGDPSLANVSLGKRVYGQWLENSKKLVSRVLLGEGLAGLQRYGDIYAGDPADVAATVENRKAEERQMRWLKSHGGDREIP